MTNSFVLTGGRNHLRNDPLLQAGQFYGADISFSDVLGTAFDAYSHQSPAEEDSQKRQIRDSIAGEVIPGSLKEGIPSRRLAPENPLTQQQWQESDDFRQDVQWHDGMTPTQARILAQRRDARVRLENLNSITGGSFAGEISGMLAAELSDSYNIATSAIPVPGIGKVTRLLGKGASIASRAGRRVVTGAAEGAFGSALVEPFLAQGNELIQEDYTFADSLQNIAMGAFVGSVLHTGVGLTKGMMRRVPTESHVQAHDTALAQAQLGKEIEVRPVIRTEPVERVEVAEQLAADPVNTVDAVDPARSLTQAPEAREFDLGKFTGIGAAGRYTDYTPVAPSERRWVEAVNDELRVTEAGHRVFKEDGTIQGVKATTPEWFQAYNRQVKEQQAENKKIRKTNETLPDEQKQKVDPVGSILTRKDVDRVANKLLKREPLGKREGEIAQVITDVARDMRRENARQMIEARQNRQFNRAQELEEFAQNAGEAAAEADHAAGKPATVAAFNDVAEFFDQIISESKVTREFSDLEAEVTRLEETVAEARKLEHLDEADEIELQRIAELEKEAQTFGDALKTAETCMRMG